MLGLLFTVLRGATFPVFSIVYGRMFVALEQALTAHDTETVAEQNVINGVAFAFVGLWGCVCTLFSGFFLGQVGEQMTMRLRVEVFKVGEGLGVHDAPTKRIESSMMISTFSILEFHSDPDRILKPRPDELELTGLENYDFWS